MSKNKDDIALPLTGMDQSVRGTLAEQVLYDVLNFRPELGAFDQTDLVAESFDLEVLSGETSNQTRGIFLIKDSVGDLQYLVLNEQTARYVDTTNTSTQAKLVVVLQTSIPTNTSKQGHLLLYGINVTDFDTDSKVLEVEIQTSTTFRWRWDSDSWTSGVTIARDVALGSNGLMLSFLDTTGYTAADVWKWTRDSYPYDASEETCLDDVPKLSLYKSDAYISGVSRNILRLRDDIITSVGYKRVFGKYAVVFENHLIVGQYAEGVNNAGDIDDTYDAAVTPYKIGWSDLNNPDEFYSTSINESGTYDLATNSVARGNKQGITGMSAIGDVLYIYRPDAIYSMQYLGLPLVFRTLPVQEVGSIFDSGLVDTPFGHYFIGRSDIYLFNGSLSAIGRPVRDKFFTEVVSESDANYEKLFGSYDSDRQEVSWTYWTLVAVGVYQVKRMVYKLEDNKWFFQNLPDHRCVGIKQGTIKKRLYGAVQEIYEDSVDFENAVFINDKRLANSQTTMTNPSLEWHWINFRNSTNIKTLTKAYIGFDWSSGGLCRFSAKASNNLDNNKPFVPANKDLDKTNDVYESTIDGVRGAWHKYKLEFIRVAKPTTSIVVSDVTVDIYGARKDVES